jgi:hypothetical protein
MMKKHSFLVFGIVAFGLAMVFIMGCASVRPMDESAMSEYGIYDDFEQFKIYQYFVSRDIVLTAVDTNVKTSVSGGQAFSSTSTHRDVINLLASTAGRCLEYDTDGETYLRLGIEFDQGKKDLLWFYFDNNDEYFYLDYTAKSKGEVEYAGKTYKVTYEEAKGIEATVKRLTTEKKSKEDYLKMEPLLLFEENVKQKETESKRTLGGSKL